MKIDRNQPLPGHTKLNYDECLAKLVLERLFPERYPKLNISDKPDLRNSYNCIGVEVTSSVKEAEYEIERLLSAHNHASNEKEKSRKIKQLNKLGVKNLDSQHLFPTYCRSSPDLCSEAIADFICAFDKKLGKLNQGHYEEMKEYDLFIISEFCMQPQQQEDRVQGILRDLLDRNVKVKGKTFSFVYALDNRTMYRWDLTSSTYNIINLSIDFMKVCFEAKEMVAEREEQDNE